MIARILSLLQLVAELSARWQHQIVSHYLHGFTNYEFWKRGTRFVTLKSHCAIYNRLQMGSVIYVLFNPSSMFGVE